MTAKQFNIQTPNFPVGSVIDLESLVREKNKANKFMMEYMGSYGKKLVTWVVDTLQKGVRLQAEAEGLSPNASDEELSQLQDRLIKREIDKNITGTKELDSKLGTDLALLVQRILYNAEVLMKIENRLKVPEDPLMAKLAYSLLDSLMTYQKKASELPKEISQDYLEVGKKYFDLAHYVYFSFQNKDNNAGYPDTIEGVPKYLGDRVDLR